LLADQDAEGDSPEVDYIFDIPVELANALCGYRHDQRLDWGNPKFTRLESIRR
jgi:hypothetical protein